MLKELCADGVLYDPLRGIAAKIAENEDNARPAAGELLDFAAEYGLSGNIRHDTIAYLVATDQNAFSRAC